IERNRILKPNGEPLYIKVPLKKHHRETKINDILIDNTQNWAEKILAQLAPYKKKARNYYEVTALLKEIFQFETDSIVEMNNHSLKMVCGKLGISTPITVWSQMNMSVEEANAPDDWALNICKALNSNVYYNPIGGASFFDREKYRSNGIELKFMQSEPIAYKQFTDEFVPFLSIVDLMMFCSIEEVNQMIDKFDLIS